MHAITAGVVPRTMAVSTPWTLRNSSCAAKSPCLRDGRLASVISNRKETTMTTQKNKPIDTLRDGAVKATIWKNPGGEGRPDFYSVSLTRTWKDDKGDYHDSDSFTGTDLLIVSRLAGEAYTRVSELRQRDRRAREEAAA